MIRLFVALALPVGVQEALSDLAWPIAGANWVSEENLHLTLRFIGEVDEGQAADIDDALARIRFDEFSIDLEGAGQFGSSRGARALWAGVAANEMLMRLQGKIERAMVAAGLPPERRKFHPHVTLARLRQAHCGSIDEFVAAHEGLAVGPIPVSGFALVSSHLSRHGAVYTSEVRYRLGEGIAAAARHYHEEA